MEGIQVNYDRSHQHVSVPAVTRGPLPRECQVGPTIRTASRQQQPILVCVHGWKSLCIRVAILGSKLRTGKYMHTDIYTRTRTCKYAPVLLTHPVTTSEPIIPPLGDRPNPTHPVVFTSTLKVMVCWTTSKLHWSS